MQFTHEQAFFLSIEECILRLKLHEEASANQKGDLLEAIWNFVKKDLKEVKFSNEACGVQIPSYSEGSSNRFINYEHAFHKKYAIEVDGQKMHLSFFEVAEAKRVNSKIFNPQQVDNRFTFFGLRGGAATTAKEVSKCVDSFKARILERAEMEETPTQAAYQAA